MVAFTVAAAVQLQAICTMYDTCKNDLLQKGIYQWGAWGDNYPSREFAVSAINRREMFILCQGGEVVGAVVLNEEQSLEWNSINWQYLAGNVLIIHALVIDPAYQNRGLGRQLLLHCEQYARQNRYHCLRLDSFAGNEKANRLYQQAGYCNSGTVLFDCKPEGNREYHCYEKLLFS